MKTLIVEDDFTSRILLQELLKDYGPLHLAVNGREAVEAFRCAMEEGQPYNLICLDIMMPEMDGHSALREMRDIEEANDIFSTNGAKIIMTTSLNDPQNIISAFSGLCDAYLVKPIEKIKLIERLHELHLIS
ncbi:MAG: response regulator [Desulfobulbus sp.]|nr:response regulator [Desulfobulbus sp.]